MKEEMSSFFSAVAELAGSRGFEVAGIKGGALNLNLNGEFAAAVDETGAMNYHPYKEVFDMMGAASKQGTGKKALGKEGKWRKLQKRKKYP